MPGVTAVRYTDLFWESLDAHRGGGNYAFLRGKIRELIAFKSETLDPMGQRDKRFATGSRSPLDGVWHFAVSRAPDIVLFYTVEDRVLDLAYVGSHHDYPEAGKNISAYRRTGTRIRNALDRGPVMSPGWTSLKWARPSDIAGHPDLSELSHAALDDLATALRQELHDAPIYRERFGHDITEAEDEAAFDWIDEASAAHEAVTEARLRKPLTGERALREIVEAVRGPGM